jgi:hypothetical protein
MGTLSAKKKLEETLKQAIKEAKVANKLLNDLSASSTKPEVFNRVSFVYTPLSTASLYYNIYKTIWLILSILFQVQELLVEKGSTAKKRKTEMFLQRLETMEGFACLISVKAKRASYRY